MEYVEVINKMYEKAEQLGKNNPKAWLLIDSVWWPNPHYTGVPVAHPECSSVFNPN